MIHCITRSNARPTENVQPEVNSELQESPITTAAAADAEIATEAPSAVTQADVTADATNESTES